MVALVTVFVPPGLTGATFEEVAIVNGDRVSLSHKPRMHNGYVVVDLTYAALISQLHGPQGLQFERANPEVISWMSEEDRRTMAFNAFPGSGRAPPPPKPEPAPVVMIKLVAPAGTSGVSIEGRELVIAKDGTVVVTAEIAATLSSHGFRAVA